MSLHNYRQFSAVADLGGSETWKLLIAIADWLLQYIYFLQKKYAHDCKIDDFGESECEGPGSDGQQ